MTAVTPSYPDGNEPWRSSSEPSHITLEVQGTPLTVERQTPLSQVITLMSYDRQICPLTCPVLSNTHPTHSPSQDSVGSPSWGLSCAVVVEKGKPIGIFTGRDLVRLAAQGIVIGNQAIETVMTSPLVTINQKSANDVFVTLSFFRQYHIRHIPIVDDDGQLVGLVTRESIRQSLKPGDLLHLHHVADTMTCEVIQTDPGATLRDIAQLMTQHQISCVVITESIGGKTFPLGIVTEGDIVQFQTLQLDFAGLTAEIVMSSPVFCVLPTLNLWQAHQYMVNHRITHLVIIHEDGTLAGLLTQTTLLNTLDPAAMVEVISLLQEQIKHLETEKLQLLESRNVELSEAVKLKTSDLEQQNKFERLLTDINNRIRSSLDFNTVLTTTTNVLQESLMVDRALVYRFNPDRSGKVMIEAIAGERWSLLNRTFCDPCFQDQSTVSLQSTAVKAIANIYESGLQDCYVQFLERIDVKSILIVPIAQDDALWGLLMLHNCHAIRNWHEREVSLIRNVSSQLAIALRQASTHEALQQELTTRQQTELLLRESEQRYASLTAVIPVVLFRANISGACIYINKRWTELTGMAQQDALGQGWWRAVYPDDQQQVMIAWQHAVQAGQPFQHEYRLQLFDGSIRWVYVQAQPEWSVIGKVCGYAGSLTDISDRKQAELALLESEQRFRRAIADAPVPIMIHAEDGEVLQISSTWTELTGYTHADIPTTQAWIERAYSEPYISVNATKIYQQYGLQSRLEEGEVTITTHNGEQRIWSFSSAPLDKLPDGRRIAIAMASDITEKQRAQAALQTSERRYRALVEVIPDLMIRQDAEGNYLDLMMSNEIKFIKPNLTPGKANVYEILPFDLAQQRMDYVRQALKTGDVQIYDFSIEVEGEQRWQEARIIAINPKEVLVIVRDISKRKRAEQKKQQAESSLRQVVEGTAAVTERDFFQELVQHIATALGVRYASISEATSDGFSILAFCADGVLQTVDDCTYEQVPCCKQALQNGLCHHPHSLLTLYPDNERFKTLKAESYIGIGLRNNAGTPIGNLCIMHDCLLAKSDWMINLLKIFGARAGAELERYQTARQLQELTNTLEQRVIERTATLAETVEHLQTEIKRRQALEDLLLQSQAQLHDIFDSANDMIQSISLIDGSFEFVNRSWLETLGYTVQDLEQLTIFDVLHPDCQERCQKLIQCLQTGKLQSLEQVEISFVAKDGRVIEAEGNVNCGFVNGYPAYTRGIFRDISDRKKAETEILNALERERELNEMKTRFVSNTSHEFRTPLTVISSNAELLKLFGNKLSEGDKQKCLETILNYVDHTTELIDDVLIVSRAESGKIIFNSKPINIIEFSKNLIQTIGFSASTYHFEFVVKDARSQAQKQIHRAELDSKILQQSLTNLLTNAIKYSPEGSTITFQLELLPNAIEFRVSDEGIGIPEDDQKYLFEPFHRATNVGSIQGTGLGLSIVKRLITVHQGIIKVNSLPGEGSCFTITVPTQWQKAKP